MVRGSYDSLGGADMTDLRVLELIEKTLLETRARQRRDRVRRTKWPQGVDLVPRHHRLETQGTAPRELAR
jgi:hypothetical protein